MNSFSANLRHLRTEKNHRQEDVAREIGVSKQVISNYENGSRQPSFDILIKLADCFNVSTDYLLGRSVFRNTSEEMSLKDGPCEDCSPDILSINLYREIKACAENARLFYKEKMRTDDGARELLFCFQEKVSRDVALFNQVFDLLMYYRDFSDRDAAIKAFLLGSDTSQLIARVIEEISRIEREI